MFGTSESGRCDPNSPNPCCSEFGWCGPQSDYNEQDHCSCDNCWDFRTSDGSVASNPGVNGGGGGSAVASQPGVNGGGSGSVAVGASGVNGGGGGGGGGSVAVGAPKNGKKESKWRFDRRCGPNYPLFDGGPTQCNPTSKNYCCSKWGWCGAQGDTPGDNDTDHCTGGIDY